MEIDRSGSPVLFHDILYSCYHNILYTAARAERVRQCKGTPAEERARWRGERWRSGISG